MSIESDKTLSGLQGRASFFAWSMFNLFYSRCGAEKERIAKPETLAANAVETGRKPMTQKRRPLWAPRFNRMAVIFRKEGLGQAVKGIGDLSLRGVACLEHAQGAKREYPCVRHRTMSPGR